MSFKKLLFGIKNKKNSLKITENYVPKEERIDSDLNSHRLLLLSAFLVKDYYLNRLQLLNEVSNESNIDTNYDLSLNIRKTRRAFDISDMKCCLLIEKIRQLFGNQSVDYNCDTNSLIKSIISVTIDSDICENSNNESILRELFQNDLSISKDVPKTELCENAMSEKMPEYETMAMTDCKQDISEIERECRLVLNETLRALSLEDINRFESYYTTPAIDSIDLRDTTLAANVQYYTPQEYRFQ